MIRVETDRQRGEVTIHGDNEGFANLAKACEDAKAGNKVFLGDPGGLLILRPEGFAGKEAPDA